MKAISCLMKSVAKAFTGGMMAKFMMENGRIIRCMAMEYWSGLIRRSIRANLRMIRGMEAEGSSGKTARFMMDHGRKESNMASDYSLELMAMRERANGRMGKESDGLKKNKKFSY